MILKRLLVACGLWLAKATQAKLMVNPKSEELQRMKTQIAANDESQNTMRYSRLKCIRTGNLQKTKP